MVEGEYSLDRRSRLPADWTAPVFMERLDRAVRSEFCNGDHKYSLELAPPGWPYK